MKMKKYVAAMSLALSGIAISPTTWAAFPNAGVDDVQSLAQFKVTFTKGFAFYLRDEMGAPFCQGYDSPADCPTGARTYTSPMLYEARTKVGRSNPHRDGDSTDEKNGAHICKTGSSSSCSTYFSATDEPITDKHFQWKKGAYQADGHPFDEGPSGREEIHTQAVSFKLTPLRGGGGANAVRAGDKAPCQARSLGEVESLNGDGFPAESFFQMYVDVDVDMNNDGKVDMVLFNEAGTRGTIVNGDPLIIESTGLTSFPPKVIYSHTGRSGSKMAPKLFTRKSTDPTKCEADTQNGHIGWLRIATHGISFGPENGITRSVKGVRDGKTPDQCQEGEVDEECMTRYFNSLPMMPIPTEEDIPFCDPKDPACIESVDLEFVTAVPVKNSVAVSWATTSEIDNAGFFVWRAQKDEAGAYTNVVKLTNELIPAQGVSHNGISYSYVDSSVESGNTYYYGIEDVDIRGKSKIHMELIPSATVK